MHVNISKAETSTPNYTRSTVPVGVIFAYPSKKEGKTLQDARIANLGVLSDGSKAYGIILTNATEGDMLGGTDLTKGDNPVVEVGRFSYVVEYFNPEDFVPSMRSQLEAGDVFMVPGKNTGKRAYLHIGERQDGTFLSVNVASNDFALSSGKDSHVIKIGKGTVEAAYLS